MLALLLNLSNSEVYEYLRFCELIEHYSLLEKY